jgi:hypothetical protein
VAIVAIPEFFSLKSGLIWHIVFECFFGMSGTGLLLFGLASDMKISQKIIINIVGRCLVQPKAQTSHIVCYCTRLPKRKKKGEKLNL